MLSFFWLGDASLYLRKGRGVLTRVALSYPLLFPALAVVFAICWVEYRSVWWLALVVLMFGMSMYSRKRLWIVAVLSASGMAFLHEARIERQRSIVEQVGEWSEQKVVLLDEPRYGKVFAEVLGGEYDGVKVQMWVAGGEVKAGDVLQVEGRWIRPDSPLNPDVFDSRSWLYRQGVSVVFVAKHVQVLNERVWWMYPKCVALQTRAFMKDRLTLGLNPESDAAQVILGMSLGMRPNAESGLLDEFRRSGVLHVFAVSGLHVMMVGGIVALVLRVFAVPRQVWIPCVMVVMFFYALVTGMKPSAMRAFVMGSIVLSAWLVQRRIVLGNSIAAGVIVLLLWDGHLLFQPGFQLSFGVLAAIALLGFFWRRVFAWIAYMDPFLPKLLYTKMQWLSLIVRKKLQASLTVASAAWCGSTPLTFWYFGLVSPIAILASVPLVFCLFVVLLCSAASLSFGLMHPWVADTINRASSEVARVALFVTHEAAGIAGGHFVKQPWQTGERVVIYALPDGGAAVYLGIGGGVLIDSAGAKSFKREVLPSLMKKGARLDSIILTHADAQHCGGIPYVLRHFTIKQAVLPEWVSRSSTYRVAQQEMNEYGVRRVAPYGEFALTKNAWIEVIYGNEELTLSGRAVADDRCLVLCLHWNGKKILFLSDVGFHFEQWAMRFLLPKKVDVVVLGQHAVDVELSAHFLESLNADYIVSEEPLSHVSTQNYVLQRRGACVIRYENSGLQVDSLRR